MLTSEKRIRINKSALSVTDKFLFLLLSVQDIFLFLVTRRYRIFYYSFKSMSPKFLDFWSKIRAKRAFYFAKKTVPAYEHHVEGANIGDWTDIPFIDKDTYVKKHTSEQRCVNGKIPLKKVAIDESSGSTGIPYNWVRSHQERKESHGSISYFSSYCFGEEPWITINAFSMGAWATGVNMGIALERNGIVKNTGPDLDKIFNTLRFFGPGYKYVITGYPPFLKLMYDEAIKTNFPWEAYHLSALVGGEGMSEGLRDYLLKGFKSVFSGYGATDLEIGIAGETPLSVSIRRLARENPDLRKELFGDDSRLPMLFQYNPFMHFAEVNDNRELLFTIMRKSVISPRIRYNIHDEGGVLRFDEMEAKLKKSGLSIDDLHTNKSTSALPFPFLWVYGRRDFTISVMGANIYPEDIEQCLYADENLAKITTSFCQTLKETSDHFVRPSFYFEVTQSPTDELTEEFRLSILSNLISINADFREAWNEYPETLNPEIVLFRKGEGPFAQDSEKIKQTRKIS